MSTKSVLIGSWQQPWTLTPSTGPTEAAELENSCSHSLLEAERWSLD